MIPDAEVVAVAWAKQDSAVNALISGRVATRLPKDWASPFLRVYQIDTELAVAETADVATALLQWDAYAHSSSLTAPDYATASLLMRTLIGRLMSNATVNLTGAGYVMDCTPVFGPRRVEEQETGWARYRADVLMAVRPAS